MLQKRGIKTEVKLFYKVCDSINFDLIFKNTKWAKRVKKNIAILITLGICLTNQ